MYATDTDSAARQELKDRMMRVHRILLVAAVRATHRQQRPAVSSSAEYIQLLVVCGEDVALADLNYAVLPFLHREETVLVVRYQHDAQVEMC